MRDRGTGQAEEGDGDISKILPGARDRGFDLESKLPPLRLIQG